jgi:hypothetical protein
LKKRSKKLFSILSLPALKGACAIARVLLFFLSAGRLNMGFLVLFFKKELLPSS